MFKATTIALALLAFLTATTGLAMAADGEWVEWQGTGACTWEVRNAGIIEFVR